MSEQPNLFEWAVNPPYARGSDTSRDAGESVREIAGRLRKEVYALIHNNGGLTCDEIEVMHGLRHQTASARIWELAGGRFIHDSGKQRPTRSGRMAVVWVSTRAVQ